MSMRGSAELRTICEVLREVNDQLQGTAKHKQVLPLLIEAESMAKKMIRKLYEYNKNADEGWWRQNQDYKKDVERRLASNYVSG